MIRCFTDQIVFSDIARFLHVSDILKLSQLSNELKAVIEKKCKAILKQNNLYLIPSKTAIHQMRFYFDRCLTVIHQENQLEATSQLMTVQNPFKFRIIKTFEVGLIYSAVLTADSQAFIFATSQITSLQQLQEGKDTNIQFERRTNIKDIKVKGEQLVYLKNDGSIWACSKEKNSLILLQKENTLEWSSSIPIKKIQGSYNFTLFFPENESISYQEFMKYVNKYDIDLAKQQLSQQHAEYHKDQVHDKGKGKTKIIVRNNLTLKYALIEFDRFENIIQTAVGHREAYFLNEHFQTFVCLLDIEAVYQRNIESSHKRKAILFKHLQNKSIIKIVSGYNFYLALERKIHKVETWSVQDVCRWVREIGFGQFAKIFNVEKVDGVKLKTINKNYMFSNLGITKPNMQQKFFMCLEQLIQNKNKEDTLYGWGKNDNGQLGSNNSNYIKYPQKIKIGILKENEYIDSIFCGWFDTYIRTQKGRIYKTIMSEKKKKVSTVKEKEEEFEKGEKEQFKDKKAMTKKIMAEYKADYEENLSDTENDYRINSKKQKAKIRQKNKRKNTHDFENLKEEKKVKRDFTHKKFQEEQKWIQCPQGKAFLVQSIKQTCFFIQCPSQKQFQPSKEKKLRTAKMVLNKIIWSLSYDDQEKYRVGYIDKDMGLIEETIYELKKFDLNQNRIKYIKKNGLIAWDRENKIDQI